MIDGKMIDGSPTVALETRAAEPKAEPITEPKIDFSHGTIDGEDIITLGEPIETAKSEDEVLDLSLGDLNPQPEQPSATDGNEE